MTREFPDELLSAFLDDELSPAERTQVEQHLAKSEADRQLVAELKSLRGDVAALPQVAVNPDFADRVVRAVLLWRRGRDQRTTGDHGDRAGSDRGARVHATRRTDHEYGSECSDANQHAS